MLVCDDELQIIRALKVILRDRGFEVLATATPRRRSTRLRSRVPTQRSSTWSCRTATGSRYARSFDPGARCRSWSSQPSARRQEKVRALDAGADDYVTKPFGPRELIARLEAALRRAGSKADEPVLRADGIELDIAGHTVRLDGGEVHLTPTEFDLLRTLMSNRGRLMTHGALLTQVWGPATPMTWRRCAPTSRTCGARSSRRAPPAHPHRGRHRLPLRRHELYGIFMRKGGNLDPVWTSGATMVTCQQASSSIGLRSRAS